MIDCEPAITVALLQNTQETSLKLEGTYHLVDGRPVTGSLIARAENGAIALEDISGQIIGQGRFFSLTPADPKTAFFTLLHVLIGISFHWERKQDQSFRGGLVLTAGSDGLFSVLNIVDLENYLASVISSEMSAQAPLEFLKAQAVTARSWLVAMLKKKKAARPLPSLAAAEIIAWQDVNDHEGFDVCADDHCQRYQGITKIISGNVVQAIEATRGMFLVHDHHICDARYYKCCGGQTEIFSTAWEDVDHPYLASVSDHTEAHAPILSEAEALAWLSCAPAAYCNTSDQETLRRILPSFDLETLHFYRWRVAYEKEALENILYNKSGIDFGELQHIIPLSRGPSGRIRQLKISGTRRTIVVGKELEIRRWLSESHLLSSAFVVTSEHDPEGRIRRFSFHGGGWGHGVGLCQIGAAVMAVQGYKAEEILAHYFTGANLQKLY